MSSAAPDPAATVGSIAYLAAKLLVTVLPAVAAPSIERPRGLRERGPTGRVWTVEGARIGVTIRTIAVR